MSVNIVNKISPKCHDCPFFEVATWTEELNYDNREVPDFKVTVDCKHHSILCDGLEARFQGGTDTERPGMKKANCTYCGKDFYFDLKKAVETGECACPRCGNRYFCIKED
nr:MAG TPA: DNA-directed RNA polymerase [Caudoviricetes sp.]